MKLTNMLLPVVALSLALNVAPRASASGTYPGTGVRPPAGGPVEAARYNLGKGIFLGTVPLSAPATPAPELAAQLQKLQAVLPASVARTAQLPALASKLTPAQFEALAYYIAVRFNVKLP